MKKILCLLLTFVLLIGMLGCSDESAKQEAQEAKVLSEEEAKELKDKGWEYYNTARFAEAIDTWQELYDGGGCDKEFLNARKNDARNDTIECKYISRAIEELRDKLKDPNSLAIYGAEIINTYDENYSFMVQFDYGATNSFGGMVRDIAISRPYSLSDVEKAVVGYQSKYYLSGNRPAEDYRGFHSSKVPDKYITAIVEGTVTNYK